MDADRLTSLAATRAQLKAQLETIQDAVDAIDAELRALPVGTHQAGPYRVQVQESRRLNAARFQAAFPAAEHPGLYKPAPDLTEIRHHIAAAELGPFQDISMRLVVT